ncbi:MAG: hydroxymethylbilane synthase, partial [Candidatus Dormibacteria bacterium]
RGEVDGAVHSAKDLPTDSPAQLRVGAYLPRADPRDALVATAGIGWQDLPRGGRVGTSSPRRSAQLHALRPDLEVVPMRGNVDTRLRRVAEGTLDACLLAQAGLDRLGLRVESSRLDPVWECTPAPAQGAVAVQVRAGGTLEEMVTAIDDPTTRACVEAERLLLRLMGGGCRLALGVLAQPVGPELVRMAVAWAAQSPTEVRRVNRLAPLAGLEALAQTLAGELR